MINQIVQWVFLPAGLTDDGQLAASIFVCPRLRSDRASTLADYPDFVDWPQTLRAGLQVTLEREDGTTEAPTSISGPGNSALWRALFPPTTPVQPYEFDQQDYADRPIATYPLLKVLDYLQDRWASLATQSTDELPIATRNASPIGPPLELDVHGMSPSGMTLASHFEALREVQRRGIFEGVDNAEDFSNRLTAALSEAAQRAATARAQHKLTLQPLIEPFALDGSDSGHLHKLIGFHRRPERKPAEFPTAQSDAAAELEANAEFHRLLSSLGDHPALLRELGLVFDLIVRPDFVPTTQDDKPASRLRVRIQRPSAFPSRVSPADPVWNMDVLPWTLTRLCNVAGQSFFSAAERQTVSRRFAHGFVRTDPDRFAAVAVDVDGLALKAFNMAATLSTQEEQTLRPIEEPADAGVPTPRTGGVAFVQTDHGQDLHAGFYQARANDAVLNELDPDNPPVLAAEELVRGYRMDMFDGGAGAWRSLHQRHVVYSALRQRDAVLNVDDEGMAQPALTGEVSRPNAPADPDGVLYVHEALITWDGWSLSAPRPGLAIAQEPAGPQAAPDLGAMKLDVRVKARPGSLPMLRFGREYRLRVRTVDLAGNAHTLEQADLLSRHLDSTGLPDYNVLLPPKPLVYRRFEPVSPPELVPRKRFAPGEGLERLVVRSNFDQSAEQYAAASQIQSDETLRFFPFCDRHVASAKASLQLAELHGMFDEALAALKRASPAGAAAAVQRYYDVAARESRTFADLPGATRVVTGVHQDQPQGFVVIDTDEVELPYLPDPLCGGAMIRLSFAPDHSEEHLLAFTSNGDWHEPLPVRVRLEEGPVASAQFVDASQRLFIIRLPRGRTARLRMSSLLRGDPDLFGILSWCRANPLLDADKVAKAIKESRHWMTTPWRTIELIHAVQQPLGEPQLSLKLDRPSVFQRQRDTTAAALSGDVSLDTVSTGRLDLFADWNEIVDDPNAGLLDVDDMVRHTHSRVFELAVPEPFGTPWGEDIREVLRQVKETRIEFNTSPQEGTPERFRQKLVSASVAPGLSIQRRHNLAAAATHIEGLRQHDLGDTKYRSINYQMVAATRFREYFDPALPAELGQRRGNVQTVEMLSSAAPPPPSIIDVVPLLRWSEAGTVAGGLTSTRRGVGLRVWLRRPWFTSGAGETLAVVCKNDGMVGTNSPAHRTVSYIARDPVHEGIVPLPLGTDKLTGAVARLNDVEVQTSAGPMNAALAIFEPRYDRTLDAWYCDLEFDTGGAYAPFVRLGLVRYQPSSIPHCETSHIVTTSFVQTLPDRALTLIRPDAEHVSVRMHGPAPHARRGLDGSIVRETNRVTATIEEQAVRVRDAALGWLAVGAEVVLTAQLQVDGSAVWTGDVPLAAGGGGPRRICVREFELHPMDDRSAAGSNTFVEARRLVHADIVALDG
jgi:hypothetical protein